MSTPTDVLGPGLHVTAAVRSTTGLVRAHNEDAVLAESAVFVVADGMGGHAAGERASALTVTQFARLVGRPRTTAQDIATLITDTNTTIVSDSRAHPERSGMGTTAVGLVGTLFGGAPHWLAFNIGDSRLYELAPAGLRRLSVDHSEVQELIDSGQITEAEAVDHPLRHVVTRSLGTDPAPPADIWMFPAEPGLRYLLCSDGLSDEVSDDEIALLAASYEPVEALATVLISAAEQAGGHDNISVIVVSVEATDSSGDADVDTCPRLPMERTPRP